LLILDPLIRLHRPHSAGTNSGEFGVGSLESKAKNWWVDVNL